MQDQVFISEDRVIFYNAIDEMRKSLDLSIYTKKDIDQGTVQTKT